MEEGKVLICGRSMATTAKHDLLLMSQVELLLLSQCSSKLSGSLFDMLLLLQKSS